MSPTISDRDDSPNKTGITSLSQGAGRAQREGFTTGQPAVVRESEASGRPASGRRGASQAPPPAGVPVSSPRASCNRGHTPAQTGSHCLRASTAMTDGREVALPGGTTEVNIPFRCSIFSSKIIFTVTANSSVVAEKI